MNLSSILLFFTFTLVHISLISGDDATDALGQEKLNDLIETSKSDNGLIKIKGSDFEKYITKGPRPYFSLVVLTALQSGNCSPCELRCACCTYCTYIIRILFI